MAAKYTLLIVSLLFLSCASEPTGASRVRLYDFLDEDYRVVDVDTLTSWRRFIPQTPGALGLYDQLTRKENLGPREAAHQVFLIGYVTRTDYLKKDLEHGDQKGISHRARR